ncbi:hypothetical protein BSK63_17385 [Paenibacillus odorifer]|uniref:hypothetical protein n=1 Tax=Paenibacillus odorifer TaxID=189426 RepID=UPI00096C34F5|nr:hypothetical protein [Paenibacillus odorifer]OME30666.1 hypothetical protein BSK63_17385 [Paenibacillus odorifer]
MTTKEIKKLFETMKFLPYAAAYDLLTALEEAEQQRERANNERDELLNEWDETFNALKENIENLERELAKAKQTISEGR